MTHVTDTSSAVASLRVGPLVCVWVVTSWMGVVSCPAAMQQPLAHSPNNGFVTGQPRPVIMTALSLFIVVQLGMAL